MRGRGIVRGRGCKYLQDGFAGKSFSPLVSSSELALYRLYGFSSKKSRSKINGYLLHAQSLIDE